MFLNQDDVTSDISNVPILRENLAMTIFDDNTVVAVISNAQVTHSISVTFVPGVEYLAYAVNLDNSMGLTTAGLLGVINGDPSDDFTYPDGTTIPPDASEELIHDWGQSCVFFFETVHSEFYHACFHRANNWTGEPVLVW